MIKAFNQKIFNKWNKRFKKLEDIFGKIDEYISIENELRTNKKFLKEIFKYLKVNSDNYIYKNAIKRLIEKAG